MDPPERTPLCIDRILVPTDGSDDTSEALEHAIDLATTYDAALHTVYVVNTSVGIDVGAGAGGTLDVLEDAGADAIDAVTQRAEAAGVNAVEGTIRRGFPHREILDYADEHDVDLVVMSTDGRGSIDTFWGASPRRSSACPTPPC